MSESQELSEDMIILHHKYVNWSAISRKQKLSFKFIKKYHKFLKWNFLLYNKHLTPDLLLKVQPYFQ
jgi:hypothetical protein